MSKGGKSDSLPPPGPSLLELKTIYEGPGGEASGRFLKKTTIIVTNRTVEIEREGANVCMTFITLGCWYMFFQTASIEIYEVSANSKFSIPVIKGVCMYARCLLKPLTNTAVLFLQLTRISRLELQDDVISGVIPGKRCGGKCGGGKFEIDLPEDSPMSIQDLVSNSRSYKSHLFVPAAFCLKLLFLLLIGVVSCLSALFNPSLLVSF